MSNQSYLDHTLSTLRSSKLWYAFCWIPVLFTIVLSIEFLFEDDVPMRYKPIILFLFMAGGFATTYVWAIAMSLLQEKLLPGTKNLFKKIVVALAFFYTVTLPFFGFSDLDSSELDLGILLISMIIIVLIGDNSKSITYGELKRRLLFKTEDS